MTAVQHRWEGQAATCNACGAEAATSQEKHFKTQGSSKDRLPDHPAPDVTLFKLKQHNELNHTQISGIKF